MKKLMLGLAATLALSTGVASASSLQTIKIYFTKAPTYGPSPEVIYPDLYINGVDTHIDLSDSTPGSPLTYSIDPSIGFKGLTSVAVSYGMVTPTLAQCTPLPTKSGTSFKLTQTNGYITCAKA